jgi:GTP cyclohydrolase IA
MAPIDTGRVEAAVAEILAAIGEDPSRPGLASTPARVAESYMDFFSGLDVDPLEHLANATELDLPPDKLGELVLLRDIDFRSMCEHHLLPFTGVAHIAYIPSRRIVGLGKIPRVVETLASRPQLQERLTEEIAETLNTGLEPRGVLVVLDSTHGCVTARGVRQSKSTTVTLATRGSLSDPVQLAGVLALLGGVAGEIDG